MSNREKILILRPGRLSGSQLSTRSSAGNHRKGQRPPPTIRATRFEIQVPRDDTNPQSTLSAVSALGCKVPGEFFCR